MEFIRRKLDHAKLIAKRSEVQKKVAEKLGRRSTDEFKLGDQVLAQNMKTLKWTIRGKWWTAGQRMTDRLDHL